MATTHLTTEPEQTKTDTFAVFADNPQDPHSNLTLLKRVEVPRYSVPTEDGVELTPGKRYQMAVQWAVTAEDSAFPVPGLQPDEQDYAMVEGQEFMVLYDLEEPMAFAEFQRNPAVAGCWNPNEESVEEFTGGSDE